MYSNVIDKYSNIFNEYKINELEKITNANFFYDNVNILLE